MLCDRPAPRELCSACRAVLAPPPAPSILRGAVPLRAATRYGGPIAEVIHKLKYEDRPNLARPLAELVWERTAMIGRGVWLVPVPLHPERLAERGYNQAALLAGHLARLSGARSVPTGLSRARPTEQQARLGRAERAENVRGAFRPRRPLAGRSVVLVDDVVTTGATAEAALAALLLGGARTIGVIAVARAA